MNILYTLNDKFVPQVAGGICSICENNKDVDDINFYLISNGISEENKKEYEETKKEVMEALKKELRPEFINRIDEIIVFHKLTDTEISQIIDIMLKEVTKRLEAQKIKIELEPEVKELIASKGIDKNFGARPLRRTIQSVLEDKLAEEILDGNLKKNKLSKIGVKDEKVVIL